MHVHTHTHTHIHMCTGVTLQTMGSIRKQQHKLLVEQHSEAELQRKREEGSEPEQRAKEDIEARKLAERE